jgi:hypothetical protein
MDELTSEIRDARKRVAALIEITRWLWVVNAIVMAVGIYYANYEIAALAGFTWVLSLIAAGIARRASLYLRAAVRTMRSS